ncbi:MAG: hypothetical protein CVU11_13595 [Bacteroidetes bacterium HGW-Bacteroidetes-6]|jgi:transcriptional regulator with XRE-family HTH domain|nr:MAG: hypothetical protein CVU11_13595 [Bacteroidetes bacterium HGW-Bacteroidetes-6]
MIEKIQLLMKIHQMSAADLAEKLGTERSGISHFLSGRNKPSLAFVQKLLENFPELNPDWLLLDKGSMLRNEEVEATRNKSVSNTVTELQFPVEEPVLDVKDESPIEYGDVDKRIEKHTPDTIRTQTPTDESIEKIVIFYTDGTFSAHKSR